MTMGLSRRRLLEAASLIAPLRVSAQTTRPGSRRVGVIWLGEKSTIFGPGSREALFRDSLRRHGWTEGQNLVIESRFAGTGVNLSKHVEQLLSMKVDVIVAMA